ncbi:MAG: PIN domain-containing protein, partial [Planctomycetes bacterium]|nr:PIN domain-containing protein [Planctomycetota bacterium]
AIQGDPNVDIVPFDANLWDRAITLYRSRPDKAWSLTDCTSFTIMGERGIHAALTADRHFVQAGFVALLDARTEPS